MEGNARNRVSIFRQHERLLKIGDVMTKNNQSSKEKVKTKNIIITIVVIIAVLFTADAIRIHFRNQAVEKIKSEAVTRQEYLNTAKANCVEGGLEEKVCQCFYSEMVDSYGIDETYKMDTASSTSNELDTRMESVLRSCYENS